MGEMGSTRRRLFVEDARQNGQYLRTTWHPEARQFVISTWSDEVCTGAVRVPVAETAPLIGMLVEGLADASTMPPETAIAAPKRLVERMWAWLRGRRRLDASEPTSVVTLTSRKSA